jgi:diguanylate cyclase (GGDEF)-like protein
VDHFKLVNDGHGHHVGDEVLKGFAKLLIEAARPGIDWVVRYGGEEFVIVLPETRVVDAIAIAEKARVAIAAHLFELANTTLKVTASFGVAGFDTDRAYRDASVDSLIGAADGCLYRSKKMGRNRVTGEEVHSDGRANS